MTMCVEKGGQKPRLPCKRAREKENCERSH